MPPPTTVPEATFSRADPRESITSHASPSPRPASRIPRPAPPDILVVGGRCSGSAAAIHLAQMGYRVLLVERARMPSDTLSTHVLWPDGIAALDRLGVLERVLATGAPPARHFRLCRGTESLSTTLLPYGAYDYLLCVQRQYLDGILWDTAAHTPGVTARDRTSVTALRWDGHHVVGAEIDGPDGHQEIDARLVVGADGRASFVAREVGASEEDVVPAGRYWYYGYFKDAQLPDPVELVESDTERDTVAAMPTNDSLLMVIYGAFHEDFDEFRRDYRENFVARVRAHPCIAEMLDGARLAAPVQGIAGVRGYYRTTYGPGWVLVGDAAHQKDPLVARGVNEALRGGAWLAEALAEGITDEALASYAATLRERTRSKALNARMLSRPDWHMTEHQAAILARELATPEGLAGYLQLEYSDTVTFEEYFGTPAG